MAEPPLEARRREWGGLRFLSLLNVVLTVELDMDRQTWNFSLAFHQTSNETFTLKGHRTLLSNGLSPDVAMVSGSTDKTVKVLGLVGSK